MLDELVSYIDAEGGMAYSSQLKGAGFSAGLISYASETGLINRISRGIYCTPDVFEDDFLVIGTLALSVTAPVCLKPPGRPGCAVLVWTRPRK